MANKAVRFTGSEWIQIPNDPSRDNVKNGFIEAIILADNTGDDNYMGDDIGGLNNDWWLYTSGGFLWFTIDATTGVVNNNSDAAPPTGAYFHYVTQWGADGVIMYINGVAQADTDAYTGPVGRTGAGITLGGTRGAGSLHGNIAMFRIYERLPGATEISDLYNGGKFRYWPVNMNGLLIWLPMDEGVGDSVFDKSSYGNVGAFNSSPTWITGPDILFMQNVPRRR